MGQLRAASWLLALILGGAAPIQVPASAPVQEPTGFWTGPASAPVPATIAGGTVVHTADVARLARGGQVLLIDVASAPHRPENLPGASLWMPAPHRDIPGSVWLPGLGEGSLDATTDAALRVRVRALVAREAGVPVVLYCHHACWLSWNAARRVMGYGVGRVMWYPDGVEGWNQAGLPLREVATGAAG